MSLMTKVQLAHLPPPHNTLYLALFADVQNAQFLRQQLLDGNREFEYAFIDASMLVSATHVLDACFRAVNDLIHNRLRSRNVHSEIVFGLGTNNNIANSLKTFGVDVSTKHMLAIKVAGTMQLDASSEFSTAQSHLQTNVQGQSLPFNDDSFANLTDWSRVCKAYKLPQSFHELTAKNQNGGLGRSIEEGDHDSASLRRQEAEKVITGLIALRGS